jgi:cytochrome P450
MDPAYDTGPFPIWDELRATCPVAHTERRGSTWLSTRYEDVVDLAHDIEHFSSSDVMVIPIDVPEDSLLAYGLPPISADPPLHTWTRRLLLPWFSHRKVESYEPMTRELCARLVDGFIADGHADAAADYAQQISVRVIAAILGVPGSMSDTFTGWARDLFEFADDPERRERARTALISYFVGEVERRGTDPGDDLLSELLHTRIDGEPIEDAVVLGAAAVVLVGGVDTTWSAIGSSLWHLATNPEDAKTLATDPGAMPLAIEELLRAYSPVTMARVVTGDVEFRGCPMAEGDKVLLTFPAANRDPEVFEDPHRVVLDRTQNRHVAFGSGIHRCAGSNLARMELRVALEEWLRRIPAFRLDEAEEVTWAGGQVRGPRCLPVVFP